MRHGHHRPPPRIGSLCTGYGGLDLAVLAVLGGHLAWVADNDPAATRLLQARWPGVPNLGDITTVDWTRVPSVDVLACGWPCQDISHAGARRGIAGPRSRLWYHVADAVGHLRPGLVFLENVAGLRTRGLEVVLADLAALRYHTTWVCLRASEVGAAHRRDRIFLLYLDSSASTWPTSQTTRLFCGVAARPDADFDHPDRTAKRPV